MCRTFTFFILSCCYLDGCYAIATNGPRIAEVAGFSALPYQLATKVKCMQPRSNLQLTRQFWQTAVSGSCYIYFCWYSISINHYILKPDFYNRNKPYPIYKLRFYYYNQYLLKLPHLNLSFFDYLHNTN